MKIIDYIKNLFSTRAANSKYAKLVERKEALEVKPIKYRKRFHGYRWWGDVCSVE